ncbi:segregation and condensation protein A [Nitrolancea hollandica]|uniref:Segregation and condensation protein A n=1 Tax=Nitrolancea hollandica Lb TaxID=1129897 RepID=I4ENG0_9BACT|nr:ScpA family protein [Nitrolancea hollandica]CCF86223.1 Chromosome segregation and condensation protein ScpA [Nitrolancea hollandica Lb]
MAATAGMTPGLAGYQLHLPTFEGPLDVLLRLIERNQLAITEVSLVAVTDQFLAYVASLQEVPPEVLADFATVATRLLVLKSRSLLPAPPEPVEPDVTEDLTAQLAAYQAVKQAADHLRQRERVGWRAFAREVPLLEDIPIQEQVAPVPLPALLRAFRRCVARGRPEPVTYTQSPIITLAMMVRRLLGRIGSGRTRFSSMVGESPTRAEVVVGFIALLSLVHRRVVEASQPALFGEIEVEQIDAVPEAADD